MPTAGTVPVVPSGIEEEFQVLLRRAGRKFGAYPAELLVRHILEIARDADAPVRREALEALLRRRAFAREEDLRIDRRPPGAAVFGAYSTRR
jgi:hypothetical protein